MLWLGGYELGYDRLADSSMRIATTNHRLRNRLQSIMVGWTPLLRSIFSSDLFPRSGCNLHPMYQQVATQWVATTTYDSFLCQSWPRLKTSKEQQSEWIWHCVWQDGVHIRWKAHLSILHIELRVWSDVRHYSSSVPAGGGKFRIVFPQGFDTLVEFFTKLSEKNAAPTYWEFSTFLLVGTPVS